MEAYGYHEYNENRCFRPSADSMILAVYLQFKNIIE